MADEKKVFGDVVIGSDEYERRIDFMRADLACNMGMSKIIDTCQKRMAAEGRDFWEEFEKSKNNK